MATEASDALFRAIDGHLRTPAVAQIGGFRPEPGLRSWFGGNFWLPQAAQWPQSHHRPMLPLLQIVISELPVCPSALQDEAVLQVFADQQELPVDLPARNGDRFLVVTRRSEPLEPREPPFSYEAPRPLPIMWHSGPQEGPSWEEATTLIDDEVVDALLSLDDWVDVYAERYESTFSTKVGGWATPIQDGGDAPGEFVLQIASEGKPGWMIGDNGRMYFYRSSDGEWLMTWDCY